MVTLTYGGSMRVMPNYNVMGVAKAALEASVRYLAYDFGEQNVRVNAISAGPVRTLAGSGVSDARIMFNYQKKNSPLRRTVTLDEIGNTALYLLSDLASAVTGEIHFVDSGYNIVSMPRLSGLKTLDDPSEANGNGNGRDEANGRVAAELASPSGGSGAGARARPPLHRASIRRRFATASPAGRRSPVPARR
jgi:hypothetical protein